LAQGEQQLIEREHAPALGAGEGRASAHQAARATLRAQIARLERELSEIVAGTFPHISPSPPAAPPAPQAPAGPALLGLAELEVARDRLAGRVADLRRLAGERAEHERRARVRLEAMRLEPGRYRFARLPVRDLGQGGCGVWEVRPRLGLIGMLAGWWQLKLSSGCPLPMGSRSTRGPSPSSPASMPACGAVARSSSRWSSSRTWGPGRGTCGSA